MEIIIREKLIEAFAPQFLEIVDESLKHAGHSGAQPGKSTHFNVSVVSSVFEGLSRIERHRKVHEVLQAELDSQIHALSLTLRSPTECP